MPVYPYEGVMPEIEQDVLLCPGAMVVGRVKIGAGSSIWYNAVIRGDVHDVVIGRNTSIQDGTLIHEDSGRGSGLDGGLPTVVGDYVTVGHGVILHACRVEDYARIMAELAHEIHGISVTAEDGFPSVKERLRGYVAGGIELEDEALGAACLKLIDVIFRSVSRSVCTFLCFHCNIALHCEIQDEQNREQDQQALPKSLFHGAPSLFFLFSV